MKTTLELPNPLMHRVKIRAASEGRKIEEMISDLIEKGLDSPQSETLPEDASSYDIDSQTGFPVSRMLNTPGFMPPTAEEFQAKVQRANEEEDLRRAGLLR